MAGYSDEIILRSVKKEYVNGFKTEIVTETEVYANRHSVKSAIFFAAQAAGKQLDVAFTVSVDEYNGQSELSHEGIIYEVINTFEPNSAEIDLNCRRR